MKRIMEAKPGEPHCEQREILQSYMHSDLVEDW